MTKRTMLLWGGGKESIIAFNKLKADGYNVTDLCMYTDVSKNKSKRQNISMSLVRKQAELLNVNLIEIPLMEFTSMSQYFESLAEWQTKIRTVYTEFANNGGTHIAFGYVDNIFELENQNVKACNLEYVYPLSKMKYDDIFNQINELNIKAWVIKSESYNPEDYHYCGVDLNDLFLTKLRQKNKNEIGEDGSYNTFVYDCDLFSSPIEFNVNSTIKVNVDDYLNDTSTLDVNSDSLLQQGLIRYYSEIY